MKSVIALALAILFAVPAVAAPCNGSNCNAGAQAGKQKFMQRGPLRRATVKIVKLGAPS